MPQKNTSTNDNNTTINNAITKRKLDEINGFQEFDQETDIIIDDKKTKIAKVYKKYGYQPIDPRSVELLSILNEKGIDSKEVFCLSTLHKGEVKDRAETQETLALRFDLTVPLARYVAQNEKTLSYPFKRYHIAKVFRGETARPKLGRFCEFYQSDIDVIGNGKLDLMYDAEFPLIISEIFTKVFGINRFIIRMNNRKFLEGLFQEFGMTDPTKIKKTVKIIDNMEKVKLEETLSKLNELGLSKHGAESILEFFHIFRESSLPNVVTTLKELKAQNALLQEGINELMIVFENILAGDVNIDNIMFDPSIARGLDYYTGTVYETLLIDNPELGSVCSGGRFEELVGTLSCNPNMKYPGCGISIGLSRLIPSLIKSGQIKTDGKTTAQVLVTMMDRNYATDYQRIATLLRKNDINTSVYCNDIKLKNQLNYADKIGVGVVIVANGDELKNGVVQVKDMKLNEGKQKDEYVENTQIVKFDDLPTIITKLIAKYKHDNASNVDEQFRHYNNCSSTQILEMTQNILNGVVGKTTVNISYTNNVDMEKYIDTLSASSKLVMWYIGSRGMRQDCCNFYKPYIESAKAKDCSTYLLDFSAWGRLNNLKISLDKKEDIKDTQHVKMITGSEYFERLNYILQDETNLAIFKEIMARKEIYDASETYQPYGVTIGQVFAPESEILKIFDPSADCSKMYSCLQYMEMMYIIEKIVNSNPTITHSINFLLPNDELKYYPQTSLKEDLEKYLSSNFDTNIDINFASFTYGNGTNDRPYNTGKRI